MEKLLQRTRLAREISLLVWLLLRIANEMIDVVSKTVNYTHVRQLPKYIHA